MMSDVYNEDGDMVWFGMSSFYRVGDIVYQYASTSQIGKVVNVGYKEIPHLAAAYAPTGKKVVEQYVLVRWLKKATQKKLGVESWMRSCTMNSLAVLAESHRQKAEKFEQEIEKAEKL